MPITSVLPILLCSRFIQILRLGGCIHLHTASVLPGGANPIMSAVWGAKTLARPLPTPLGVRLLTAPLRLKQVPQSVHAPQAHPLVSHQPACQQDYRAQDSLSAPMFHITSLHSVAMSLPAKHVFIAPLCDIVKNLFIEFEPVLYCVNPDNLRARLFVWQWYVYLFHQHGIVEALRTCFRIRSYSN